MAKDTRTTYASEDVNLERPSEPTALDLAIDHVGYSATMPDAYCAMDRRDCHILHYVASGKGTFTFKCVDYALTAGDFYLFPKNTSVSYRANPQDPWRVYYIGFYGTKDDYYVRMLSLSPDNVALRGEPNPAILSLYQKTISSAQQENASRTMLVGYLYQIFGALLCSQANQEDRVVSISPFQAITNYISSNLSQPLRVATIAEIHHISESQMFRIFKAQCGLSPHQYIEKARIDLACTLLRRSRLSIQEISLRCGYEYESHFYKSFQKLMGVTPFKYKTHQE